MTIHSDLRTYMAPILVLGLGTSTSGDDGVGAILLDELSKRYRYAGKFVEFLHGGNRGLDLLEDIAGRPAVLILDAIATENQPGDVCVLERSDALRYATTGQPSVHDGDARELLSTAAFLGDLPENFCVLGVRPASGHGTFSRCVQQALPSAVQEAQSIVDRFLVELTEPVQA
jgi:hydrogenase maturation protease